MCDNVVKQMVLSDNQNIPVHCRMYECNYNVEDILKEIMFSCHKAKSPNNFSSDEEDSFSSEHFDLLEGNLPESKNNLSEEFSYKGKIQRSLSDPDIRKNSK